MEKRSIYTPDGFSVFFLNAQLTIGEPRVEYASWTDSPSRSHWSIPPASHQRCESWELLAMLALVG